jgi:SNF2 family DNA or RNA helicase
VASETLNFTPRPWQVPIMDHAIDLHRGGIWAGMGLGKTTAALTATDYMLLAGEISGPTLVTAPKLVANQVWPDEARKWHQLRHVEVQPIAGTKAQRIAALRNPNASVFTVSYDNLPWLREHLEETRTRWPFPQVIADEATKLKGFRIKQGSVRAHSLAKSAHREVTRFTELTGTPSPNGLKDLWGQIWFLDHGRRLGTTYESFKLRWFQRALSGYGIEPLPFAFDEIQRLLKDICLSVDIRDYIDIREPIVSTIYVDLPGRARAMYDSMEEEFFAQIEGHEIEALNAAAKSMKCLQIANGAVYVETERQEDSTGPEMHRFVEVHDVKIQALESVIEEFNGTPLLVAYHFKSDLKRLLRAFPHGRRLDDNPRTIREWNEGLIPLLFAHPRSAGHGLNLQDGSNVLVFFGHNWDLEGFLQIIERIGPVRQMQAGHDREVYLIHIVARDTIEEVVMERMSGKKSLQDLLLEAMKKRRKK